MKHFPLFLPNWLFHWTRKKNPKPLANISNKIHILYVCRQFWEFQGSKFVYQFNITWKKTKKAPCSCTWSRLLNHILIIPVQAFLVSLAPLSPVVGKFWDYISCCLLQKFLFQRWLTVRIGFIKKISSDNRFQRWRNNHQVTRRWISLTHC